MVESRSRETCKYASGFIQAGNRKNGVKWLDFWYVLMVGLTGCADGLDVIQDKGDSA